MTDLETYQKTLLQTIKNYADLKSQMFINQSCDLKFARAVVLGFLTRNLKTKGIYISVKQTYRETLEDFGGTGIDDKKLYFIVKKELLSNINEPNVYELNIPISHVELSFAISNQSNSKEYNFLYFDHVYDMLKRYSVETVEKFLFYLVSNLSYRGINLILNCGTEIPRKTLDRIRNYVNEMVII